MDSGTKNVTPPMKKVLEFGAGKTPAIRDDAEVIHLDVLKLPHIEVVHNLEKFPYPFKDNTFDEILAFHVLEHISDTVKVMEEIHRISKNGAIVTIEVPYYNSPSSFRDPTHKSYFSEGTMDYFTDNGVYNYYTKVRFEIKSKKYITSFIGRLLPEALLIKLAHYVGNIITIIRFTLIVKKD